MVDKVLTQKLLSVAKILILKCIYPFIFQVVGPPGDPGDPGPPVILSR